MEYRRMGRTGLKVSEICLGTMTFGHSTDEAEAKRIVDLAFDAGINFFDTANSYAESRSETILGKALQGRRHEVIVATKVFNPMGANPNQSGMSRVHIMQAVEDSLNRLQTDYVDIYYIHHVDTQTPLQEMLRAFDDLVTQAGGELDPQTRCDLYAQAEMIMLEDVAAVFVEHPKEVQLFKPNIGGIKLRADGIEHDYTGMTNDIYITQ